MHLFCLTEFGEMMMMQNAHMHQMVMQKMMMGSLHKDCSCHGDSCGCHGDSCSCHCAPAVCYPSNYGYGYGGYAGYPGYSGFHASYDCYPMVCL